MSLFLNGTSIGNVKVGEKFSALVPAGEHVFHVAMDGFRSPGFIFKVAAHEHVNLGYTIPAGIKRMGAFFRPKDFYHVHINKRTLLDAGHEQWAELEQAVGHNSIKSWISESGIEEAIKIETSRAVRIDKHLSRLEWVALAVVAGVGVGYALKESKKKPNTDGALLNRVTEAMSDTSRSQSR